MTIMKQTSASVILWDSPLTHGVLYEIMKRRKMIFGICEITPDEFKNLLIGQRANYVLC